MKRPTVQNPRAVILLVDDEVDLREILKLEFEDRGCRVIEANNGKEALAVLRREKVDVVFTDVVMPEMSGTQFLEEIKLQGSEAPLVVTMSGYTSTSESEILDLGAAGFLPKPFTNQQLIELIESYFVLLGKDPAPKAA